MTFLLFIAKVNVVDLRSQSPDFATIRFDGDQDVGGDVLASHDNKFYYLRIYFSVFCRCFRVLHRLYR